MVQTSFQEVSFISAKGGDLELLCVGFVVLENVYGDFDCHGAFGWVPKLRNGFVKCLEYGGAFLKILMCVDLVLAFGRLEQKWSWGW